MELTLLKVLRWQGEQYQANDTITVDPATAKRWVNIGLATTDAPLPPEHLDGPALAALQLEYALAKAQVATQESELGEYRAILAPHRLETDPSPVDTLDRLVGSLSLTRLPTDALARIASVKGVGDARGPEIVAALLAPPVSVSETSGN